MFSEVQIHDIFKMFVGKIYYAAGFAALPYTLYN